MKVKLLFLIGALLVVGCSLIWGPTATVKKFIAGAEKGDVEQMNSLFSTKAVEKLGIEKIRSNNQNFANMVHKAIAGGAKPRIDELRETINGATARVSLVYRDDAMMSSIGLGFDLTKENGAWKIVNIGNREPGDHGGTTANPATAGSPEKETAPPPPPPAPSPRGASASPPRSPISGGVLNGKAISLPKPAYPPVAKAAKASGTVVVQVTVDENGDVVAAHAVSGHPLLQAAAVAAAHNAKFSPTKLSGQPVKVTGVITYNFVPE